MTKKRPVRTIRESSSERSRDEFFIIWFGYFCDICTFAAYYVAFGPYGPRKPVNPPGTVYKILLGTAATIGAAGAIYIAVRSAGACSLCCPWLICLTILSNSSSSSEDDDKRVAGGYERKSHRAKDEPHLWYVRFICDPTNCAQPLPQFQVLLRKITRGRASLPLARNVQNRRRFSNERKFHLHIPCEPYFGRNPKFKHL